MPVRRRGDEGKEERKRGDDEGKEGERTRRGLVMFRLFASVMLNSKEKKKINQIHFREDINVRCCNSVRDSRSDGKARKLSRMS